MSPEAWPATRNSELYNAMMYVSLLFFITIFIVGVAANSIVIWLICCKVKQTQITVWFFNLAAADVIVIFFLPLRVVSIFLGYWPFGTPLCKIFQFISVLNIYASGFILTAVNIDRCISVVQPLWYHKHKLTKRSSKVCLVLWCMTVILSLPLLLYSTAEQPHQNQTMPQCQPMDFSTGELDSSEIVDDMDTEKDIVVSSTHGMSSTHSDMMLFGTGHSLKKRDFLNETASIRADFVGRSNSSGEKQKYADYGPRFIFLDIASLLHFQQRHETSETKNLLSSNINKTCAHMLKARIKSVFIVVLVFGFLIPLVIILACNLIIGYRVIPSHSPYSTKLYRTITAVVTAYFLTAAPLNIAGVLCLVTVHTCNVLLHGVLMDILPLIFSITYMNSCINPILYVLLGKNIRKILAESASTVWKSLPSRTHLLEPALTVS